ncbi:unnamed protein product, partial [Iphiclides podalirius]
MESALTSDDSCDSEMKTMKNLLSEFDLHEENLSKEEMVDLLKALKNSKSTVKEEERLRQKVEDYQCSGTAKINLKRKYLNVRDRRMPWSILPNTITAAEKAHTLAVYIKMMSINNYRQARQCVNFAAWPPPIQILEESTRVQPVRSTRSGRTVPAYCGFDDDSSDFDIIVTKTKKRKASQSEGNLDDGVYSNKVISLKRKTTKEEGASRPVKEPKIDAVVNKPEVTKNGKINTPHSLQWLTCLDLSCGPTVPLLDKRCCLASNPLILSPLVILSQLTLRGPGQWFLVFPVPDSPCSKSSKGYGPRAKGTPHI